MSEVSIIFADIASDTPELTVRVSGGEFVAGREYGFVLDGSAEKLVATGDTIRIVPRGSNQRYRCELRASLNASGGDPIVEIGDGMPDEERPRRAHEAEMRRRDATRALGFLSQLLNPAEPPQRIDVTWPTPSGLRTASAQFGVPLMLEDFAR